MARSPAARSTILCSGSSPCLVASSSARARNLSPTMQASSDASCFPFPQQSGSPILLRGEIGVAAYSPIQSMAALGPSRTSPIRRELFVPHLSVPAALPSTFPQIESIIVEMENEMSKIDDSEMFRDRRSIRDKYLPEMSRILERELEGEFGRLTALEANHITLKRQVQELEFQRKAVEAERNDLLHIGAGLEAKCVEFEKKVAQLTDQCSNAESKLVLEKNAFAEAVAARFAAEADLTSEKHVSVKAVAAQLATEADLANLKAEFRGVLDSCQSLTEKVQYLENQSEAVQLRSEQRHKSDQLHTSSIEQEHAAAIERIAELELAARTHHSNVTRMEEEHHNFKSAHTLELEMLKKQLLQADAQKIRIQELEQELLAAFSMKRSSDANQKHVESLARVQELERELLGASSAKDSISRKCNSYKTRVSELEQQLHDHGLLHEKCDGLRTRIHDLERELRDTEATSNDQAKQQSFHRNRIRELEIQLQSLQEGAEGHAKQHREHKEQIASLTRELEEERLSRLNQDRREKAITERTEEFEKRIADADYSVSQHVQEQSAQRQRIIELEGELASLRKQAEGHTRSNEYLTTTISQLEEELARRQESHSQIQRELHNRISEMEKEALMNGQKSGVLDDAAVLEVIQRTANIMEEINAVRVEVAASRDSVDVARVSAEKLQADAESALSAQDRLLESKTREFEEKYASLQAEYEAQLATSGAGQKDEVDMLMKKVVQLEERCSFLQAEKADLEMQITRGHTRADSFMPSMTSTTQGSEAPRSSLLGGISSRAHLRGEILPGNVDPFVIKIRETITYAAEAMDVADEAHRNGIRSQMQKLLETVSASTTCDLTSAILDYARRAEIEGERRAAADNVESVVHDLKALREELNIQHQLPTSEKDVVFERLDLELAACKDELGLLHTTSALEGIPESVLRTLVDFNVSGPLVAWPEGFTPMHWAAQNGRKDIADHLLSLEGGSALLHAHDNLGRNPLYYAQQGKHTAFEMWLREEMKINGISVPVHDTSNMPQVEGLPEAYQKVLMEIHHHGWRAMKWRAGYTMLHWAANKGHTDLCAYLIQLDADPGVRDDKGRSPIDLAAGNHELFSFLQNLLEQRNNSDM